MKSETINCPGCLAELRKSDAAFVLGEALSGHAHLGAVARVRCPACGCAIDVRKMLDGAYDAPQDSHLPWLVYLGACGIGGAAFLEKHGARFWPAFVGVVVALVLVPMIGSWLIGGGEKREE